MSCLLLASPYNCVMAQNARKYMPTSHTPALETLSRKCLTDIWADTRARSLRHNGFSVNLFGKSDRVINGLAHTGNKSRRRNREECYCNHTSTRQDYPEKFHQSPSLMTFKRVQNPLSAVHAVPAFLSDTGDRAQCLKPVVVNDNYSGRSCCLTGICHRKSYPFQLSHTGPIYPRS